ncbi:MAG: carbamoyltransferase HypF, partial [Candidatus Omnitrophica bacterium]|nr:carbamoyltransferase HypF [Candidatus Omnitrophota bacterium]
RLSTNIQKPVLALGSDVKNTVCFAKGNRAFVSEANGDLREPAAFKRFEDTIRAISHGFKAQPHLIACDLHPEYFSTKYASTFFPSTKVMRIQHHHAHICSSMAENGLPNKNVIGIAFDGTGFGNDSTFWGAEFLICDYSSFVRRAHLTPVPLAGGEKAILEPWRLLFAWLYYIYKNELLTANIYLLKGVNKKNLDVIKGMISSGYNSPIASSMGRLFDAVGALVLRKYKVNYEAEAAIALEKCASRASSSLNSPYDFNIVKAKEKYIIDPIPLFKDILEDMLRKEKKSVIAYRFHQTVGQMIKKMCLRLRMDEGINKVVLSGGVFQNKILLSAALDLLRKERFEVITHKVLSCSDAGISLGQAVIAGHK